MRDWRWPRVWLGIWLLGWALCIVLSLAPLSAMPAPGGDKLGHVLAYSALSAWAAAIFRPGRPQWRAWLALWLLGLALELAQGWLTRERLAEASDLLANLAGIALGSRCGELLARGLRVVEAASTGERR